MTEKEEAEIINKAVNWIPIKVELLVKIALIEIELAQIILKLKK
jgi:hypothetical protein